MSDNIGLVWNKATILGRVVGNPTVQNGWASLQVRTQVPEPRQGGGWDVTDCMVPCLTNNPKTLETIQSFVQDQRQVMIEGYVKAWDGGFGVMVTTVKLGSKTIYNPNDNNQQGGQGGPGGFTPGQSGYGGGQQGGMPGFPQG